MFSLLFLPQILFAQPINENDLFSNPETVIPTEKIVNTQPPEEDKKGIAITGELTSVLQFTGTRNWIEKNDSTNNRLLTYILNNLYLDVRLKNGIKGFANVETTYYSQFSLTNLTLKELFFDFNFNRTLYFRTGKQVLQWGRCFLWNPTDLINLDKKTFITRIGSREGAYGIKIHIPFGTILNYYGFLDTGNSQQLDETGVAEKIELLWGKTEMAIAWWSKKQYNPVYSYDFSTRLFSLDMYGEVAGSYGDNNYTLKIEPAGLSKQKIQNSWISRASFGCGRTFDLFEIKDRVNLHTEFYYNQTGYDKNVFVDTTKYNYLTPVLVTDTQGILVPKLNGTIKEFILENKMYEMNYFSRGYAAVFGSISRFIITDLTLNLNLITNLNDGSAIITTGLRYRNINDLSLGLEIYGFIGPAEAEYTYFNDAVSCRLFASISF